MALLVIAADDGVMPQRSEHVRIWNFSVCDADRRPDQDGSGDRETVEYRLAETREFLEGRS